jgi:8-oxo-dGTP diphosphatase
MYNPEKAHYVVATCILVKDGKYLIAKRAPFEKAFPNKWTVPGGTLETSDYKNRPCDTSCQWYNIFEEICKREVEEEVGIKVDKMKYLASLVFIRQDNIPTVIASMFCHTSEDKVRLSEELTDYAWVTLEEAKKYDLIDGIYEELELLEKHLKGEDLGVWGKK